jgi:predicted phosphodiesterase
MFQTTLRWCSVVLTLLFLSRALANSHMAIMGDAGQAGSALDSLRNSLTQAGVNSVIMPGDNLYSGTYSRTWDDWKKQGLKFDVVAIGNHNGGYKQEVQYFSMPGEYYSVKKNGALFLVLNSDNKGSVDKQMLWLDEALQKATEELVFIVYHHPTFTITKDHKWQEKSHFQLGMRQILKRYNNRISALILGHDHIGSLLEFGSVPVIVAGSGREVRSAKPVSYTEDGFLIQTRFLAPRIQHWADLEILEGAHEARVHLTRVRDGQRVCSAILSRGTMELDSNCSLTK